MAAPTLVDYQESNWGDSVSTSEATATVTWSAGDFLVCLGMTADNAVTLGTPTYAGGTFAAVAGTPTNTADHCKGYAWTSVAGSGGSSAVTATAGGSPSTAVRGIAVWVYSGSDGLGNTAINADTGTAEVISLIRSGDNSAVVWALADWDAVADTSVSATPVGGTQREAVNVSGGWTAFVFDWADQGASGTTNYGVTGAAATRPCQIAVEVLGTAGGGGGDTPTPTVPPTMVFIPGRRDRGRRPA